MAVGHAIGVRRRTVARYLGVNPGAAPAGLFEFFQHQYAGALTEHEPITLLVERSGRLLWGIVASRESRQQAEAGQAERVDNAVRATGQHHVGVAAADQLRGLADRLAA